MQELLNDEDLDRVGGAGPTECFPEPTWPWDSPSSDKKLPGELA